MTNQQRTVLTVVVAGLVGFAAGALWQYVGARGEARRAAAVERELTFTSLEARLAGAAVEAQRGSFERSRQLASSFFGELQEEIGSAPADVQPALRKLLERRDIVITGLSRSDPAAAALLIDLFTRYRIAIGGLGDGG